MERPARTPQQAQLNNRANAARAREASQAALSRELVSARAEQEVRSQTHLM